MRALFIVSLLWLQILVIAALPVYADTLLLLDEGKVDGTVEEVVLLVNGAERKLAKGQFVAVQLGTNAEDVVQVDEKTAEKGELVSVSIQTIAGLLTFKRKELKTIALAPTAEADIRKEYEARRAKVKDDDPDGLYGLALWCQEMKLKKEMRELAELCLKAKPKPETEAVAHRLLGHVLRAGKWVEEATAAPAEEPTQPAQPAQPAKPDQTPAATKADPAAAELYRKLTAEYDKKTADTKAKELETLKSQYTDKWKKFDTEFKKAEKEHTDADQKKADLRRQLDDEIRRVGYTDTSNWNDYVNRLRSDYDQACDRANRAQSSLDSVKRERSALLAKARGAKETADARASDHEQHLTLAKKKIERLLLQGRTLTEADMRGILDEALKEP